jgi:hypothetical protein
LQISRLAHMGSERAMARDARLAHAGGRRMSASRGTIFGAPITTIGKLI